MYHPAKYSDELLPFFKRELGGFKHVLDPFAGTGKLRDVRPDAILVEIEPEWAKMRGAIVANARYLPFVNGAFDAICTSPTYGNRLADCLTDDGTRRYTYNLALGRALRDENTGRLQWGSMYRRFHWAVWQECVRVLKPCGRFVLNIADHIRLGVIQEVSLWHEKALRKLGFVLTREYKVSTHKLVDGENWQARIPFEYVKVFDLVGDEHAKAQEC